jgi:folylpolyglutamate synthase
METQKIYAEVWKRIDPKAKIAIEPTIEGALKLAKSIGDQGNGMQTLVTGSLHLVGGALCLLEPSSPARKTPPY